MLDGQELAKLAGRNARLNVFNSILMFLVFHLLIGIQSKFSEIYTFQDVSDLTLLARTNYHLPNISDSVPGLKLAPFHFAQYQFYPLWLRMIHALTFNDSW